MSTKQLDRTPPNVGRRSLDTIGELMHVVEHPFAACPVPGCGTGGPMRVYTGAVRWRCGHTRDLPPIDYRCYKACHHNIGRRLKAVA